eukprot:scaffold588757_cov47-Prasinocladus_malaysianus.AAC.1
MSMSSCSLLVYDFAASQCVILPVAHFVPGNDGDWFHEDIVDTLYMLYSSPEIVALVLLYMLAVVGLNLSGVCIIGQAPGSCAAFYGGLLLLGSDFLHSHAVQPHHGCLGSHAGDVLRTPRRKVGGAMGGLLVPAGNRVITL